MPRPGCHHICFILILFAAGCAQANRPLNSVQVPSESWIHNQTRAAFESPANPEAPNDDGWFVGLALSGGGSRSANFSAACMFELQRIGLLQRVDYISSVSGGSLTAAYYCTTRDGWTPAEVQQRLTHPFATDLIVATFLPWNSLALIFTPWNRSDILANSFNRVLYSKHGRNLTFADLRADRPRLLINTTDLQTGDKFVFSNENFDSINSDLAKYPIGNAVAASSAVPVLMHQVTIRDYSTIFARYRHLIDGGINDNLGITSLVEAYTSQIDRARATHQKDPYPRGMVLIVIDAHTTFDSELDDRPDLGIIGSLAAATGLSSTALLNRVSSATLADIIVKYSSDETTAKALRDQIAQLEKTGMLRTRDRDGKPVRVVHLALSRIGELHDLPFYGFGESVNSIATYFNISETEAYHLYAAAKLLIHDKFEDELNDVTKNLDTQSEPR